MPNNWAIRAAQWDSAALNPMLRYERAGRQHEVWYLDAVTALNELRAAYDLGDTQKALDDYSHALALEHAVGERAAEGETLDSMGEAYDDLKDKQKALDCFRRALPLVHEAGERDAERETLDGIARAYDDLGEAQKALDYYARALPLERAAGDRAAEAQTLDSMGRAYDDLDLKQKAQEYFAQALPLERSMSDRALEGQTLDAIGSVYENLGKEEKALDYFAQALPLERAAADRAGEAATLNKIGGIYDDSGDKQKSLDYFTQALPLVHTVGDHSQEAATLDKIGSDATELGKKQDALDSYIQALALVRAFQLTVAEVSVLSHVMNYWRRADQPTLAIFWGLQTANASQRVWGEVLNLDAGGRESFDQSNRMTDRNLADLLISQGRTSEAGKVLGIVKQEKEYFEPANHAASRPANPVATLPLDSNEMEMQEELERVGEQLAAAGQEWAQLSAKPPEAGSQEEEQRLAIASKQLDVANSALKIFFERLDSQDHFLKAHGS